MNDFLQDLKHGVRAFLRSPVFTVTAIAALALGIGANTAIFSVVNAVLLRPLAFPDAERLVFIGFSAAPAHLVHFRTQLHSLRKISGFRFGTMTFTRGDQPERIAWGQVSADFFPLFGAPVARGRTFTAEEDLPGASPVAVLSDGFWRRQFGSDPSAVGRSITLNGERHLVVGVLGPEFDPHDLGPTSEVYTPFKLDPHAVDQGEFFQVAARLDPGVPFDQAQAELGGSTAAYREKFPHVLNDKFTFRLFSIQEVVISNGRRPLMMLAGAVALVLLIACANVANLLLARGSGRRRELAIRASLGAGRGRILRQLLTESMVLSVVGGAVGLALGFLGIKALLAVSAAGIPRLRGDASLVTLDWRVVAFTLGLSLLTGIVFGVFPALAASRTDLNTNLREGGGRAGTGFRQRKTQSTLVAAEVMLALVLLVGSALLIRTSVAVSAIDPGFDSRNVLTMTTAISDRRFSTSGSVHQLIQDGTRRLETIPGVEEVSASCCIPIGNQNYNLPVVVVGRPLSEKWHALVGWYPVAPRYFETFKIPLSRGRTFTERDDTKSQPVVIINQAMAKLLWPDHDPLNQQILIPGGVMKELAGETERAIVGIVGDVRNGGLRWSGQPAMYVPAAQVPDGMNAMIGQMEPLTWVVRTKGAPRALSREIQSSLRLASGLAVADVRTMRAVVSNSQAWFATYLWLITVFATVAVALSAIGIYGVMAYTVQQRVQEMGIRMALGANPIQVRRMVIRQGMRPAVIGLAVGSVLALWVTKIIAGMLFEVTARDPITYAQVVVLLGVIAFLSVWIPARRASAVAPIEALRAE